MEPFEQAVQAIGGTMKMAEHLGVTHSFVSQITSGRRPLPAKYVLRVESLTGISRYDLAPEVFGKRPGKAA